MIARFFLGVFEAGLIPGTIHYISIWYKRSEQNIRVGAVLSGPTFAGALSGLLSYAIISLLDSKAGLSGWQWIFLMCGLVTIIVSIVAFFLISDSVEDAKWLNKEDRNRVNSRVRHDELLYTFSQSSETSDSIKIGVALISNRMNLRGPFVILFATIGIFGYAIVATVQNSAIFKYIGTWLIAIGAFPCRATSTTWLANNIAPSLKRNVVISLMVGSGSIGGIIATQIYRSVDYPNYTLGHIISSICLFLAVCLSIIQYAILKLKNKNMKEKRRKIRRAVSWNVESGKFDHFL
ncbi:1677_t:CDS:2 [Cetraspora pellucida]|uniref:1677_t:CDS:1 n=1 Tax=Cetraspora pellucida TaxID=1433469 RepID=A0ACA9KTI5_9GLOM|nr:1677_t:CDS:2 [Cetraspora pellucida]